MSESNTRVVYLSQEMLYHRHEGPSLPGAIFARNQCKDASALRYVRLELNNSLNEVFRVTNAWQDLESSRLCN
jgi:hypothetical protein